MKFTQGEEKKKMMKTLRSGSFQTMLIVVSMVIPLLFIQIYDATPGVKKFASVFVVVVGTLMLISAAIGRGLYDFLKI